MFGFGNSSRIDSLLVMIEEQNKLIGDLQERLDKMKEQFDDLDISRQVEDAVDGIDFVDMARDAIDEAMNNASLSVSF